MPSIPDTSWRESAIAGPEKTAGDHRIFFSNHNFHNYRSPLFSSLSMGLFAARAVYMKMRGTRALMAVTTS